jgi:hypothetical protein
MRSEISWRPRGSRPDIGSSRNTRRAIDEAWRSQRASFFRVFGSGYLRLRSSDFLKARGSAVSLPGKSEERPK